MLKPSFLRPWATAARQLSLTSTSTVLRGPSSSSFPTSSPLTRAITLPSFFSYRKEPPAEKTKQRPKSTEGWPKAEKITPRPKITEGWPQTIEARRGMLPDPWKEWIRPNRNTQARKELYGDRWIETLTGREFASEMKTQGEREKTRKHLRAKLGDRYEAVVKENMKEAYERYETPEWRKDVEQAKKEMTEKDNGRRKAGSLTIYPILPFEPMKSQD